MEQGKGSGDGEGNRGRVWALGQLWPAASAVAITAAILAADLQLPSSVATGVAYGVPIYLVARNATPALILFWSAVASGLTIAGDLFSSSPSTTAPGLANLALGLCAIWGLAFILTNERNTEHERQDVAERLERELASQGEELAHVRGELARSERFATLGRIAGTVSHDLRNPLGVVMTSIAVIEAKAGTANADIVAALSRAKRAIERCDGIIAEHLDAVRAKGHSPEPTVLDDWLASLLDEIAIPDSVVLRQRLDAGDAVVSLDIEALGRAMINLIDNACQAMGSMEATERRRILTISTDSVEGGVEITVADTGPGIAPEVLKRLPEPLFSTKPWGTGLGLATVQRVVDDHGGRFRIESQPGQGATVVLRLPANGTG